MLEDSGSGAKSYFYYHPSMLDRALSRLRSGEVSCFLVSEDPRSGLGGSGSRSVDFVVPPDIDLPCASLPLPAASFVPVAFGLAPVRHFAGLSNRQLSEGCSRSAPERL